MNTELLLKVKAHILEDPKSLEMSEFIFDVPATWANAPSCGTVACIAGWACLLGGAPKLREAATIINEATRLLEITEKQADSLFYVTGWPDPNMEQYFGGRKGAALEVLQDRAQVTAQRIDDFIASEGSE